jgi:hypothetical protein
LVYLSALLFQNSYIIRGGTQKKPETFSGGRVRCSICFRR